MDTRRIVEIFASNQNGHGEAGSGYLVDDNLILTAKHTIQGNQIDVRLLGANTWIPATVEWQSIQSDLAILRTPENAMDVPSGGPVLRWGQMERSGSEPIAVSAVGFPRAQVRSDGSRESEGVWGFVVPSTEVKRGTLAITVMSSSPSDDRGASPWAGMSGAGVFAGRELIGVVVVDPTNFDNRRLIAESMESLLADATAPRNLFGNKRAIRSITQDVRIAITSKISIILDPPYRAYQHLERVIESRLLLPEFGIVPFHGREHELKELMEWCRSSERGNSLRVITGDGGSGKSRLAREVCSRLLDEGWLAGIANQTAPGGLEALEPDRPTLIVVDDADQDGELIRAIVTRMERTESTAPIHLLLVARDHGAWWQSLAGQTHQAAPALASEPMHLSQHPLEYSNRSVQYKNAVQAFSNALGRRPASTDHDLQDDDYSNHILVHILALLDVLEVPLSANDGGVRTRLLEALLAREELHWKHDYPVHLVTPRSTAQQIVALGTLGVPESLNNLAEMISAVPALSDLGIGSRETLSEWLIGRYPTRDRFGCVAPLRPDVLSEQLLATTANLAVLVEGAWRQLHTPRQQINFLFQLRQASGRRNVDSVVDSFLAEHLSELIVIAARLPETAIGDNTAALLDAHPQPAVIARTDWRIPAESVGLGELAIRLAEQESQQAAAELEAERTGPAMAIYAFAMTNLAVRYSTAGRYSDALEASLTSKKVFDGLTFADPSAIREFGYSKSVVLEGLSNCLSDLRRDDEALEYARGVMEIRSSLEEHYPGNYQDELAAAWNNYSNRLADCGKFDDAASAIERSVELRRALARRDTDHYAPALARSLNNQSERFAEVNRRSEALESSVEAVALYRDLFGSSPDEYASDLAGALNNHFRRFLDLDRTSEALPLIEESVSLRRHLVELRPATFLPDLARSLANFGGALSRLKRYSEGIQVAVEACGYLKDLARTYPSVYVRQFAGCKQNLADMILSSGGDQVAALDALGEIVDLYSETSRSTADVADPELALAYLKIARLLISSGRYREAFDNARLGIEVLSARASLDMRSSGALIGDQLRMISTQLYSAQFLVEALEVSQASVDVERRMSSPAHLAGSLAILSTLQAEVGEIGAAIASMRESLACFRATESEPSTSYLISLADAVELCARAGEVDECLARADELEGIFLIRQSGEHPDICDHIVSTLSTAMRFLIQDGAGSPAAVRIATVSVVVMRSSGDVAGLADTLNNLSNRLDEVGEKADALAVAFEAVTIFARLNSEGTLEASAPNFAIALYTWSLRLEDAGRTGDAITAIGHALNLLAPIVESNDEHYRPLVSKIYSRYIELTQ